MRNIIKGVIELMQKVSWIAFCLLTLDIAVAHAFGDKSRSRAGEVNLIISGNTCTADADGRLSFPNKNQIYSYSLAKHKLRPLTSKVEDCRYPMSDGNGHIFYIRTDHSSRSNALMRLSLSNEHSDEVLRLPQGDIDRCEIDEQTTRILVFYRESPKVQSKVGLTRSVGLISRGKFSLLMRSAYDCFFDHHRSLVWITSPNGISAYDCVKQTMLLESPKIAPQLFVVTGCAGPNGQLLFLGCDKEYQPVVWRYEGLGARLILVPFESSTDESKLPSAWTTVPLLRFDSRERRYLIHWVTRMASYESNSTEEMNIRSKLFQPVSDGRYVCQSQDGSFELIRNWVGSPFAKPHVKSVLVDQLAFRSKRSKKSILLTPRAFEVSDCVPVW